MIVYKLTNKINGKEYVGKTIGTLDNRWKEHVADAGRGSDRIICRAIRKYGQENFTLTQIDTTTSEEELNKKEIYWIAELNTCVAVGGTGYNMTLGGEGTSGLKRTEESKAMMSEKMAGRKCAWADKVSAGMKKVFAEDVVIREQILNNIDKMVEGNKKPIEALVDGVWVRFEAIKDFCDKYNAASPNVLEVLVGKTNTIKGFKVRWVDLEARDLADKRIAERKNKKGTHKAVKCIETGEVFKNGITAAKSFKIQTTSVYYSVKNGWACKLPEQNKKVHFELVK